MSYATTDDLKERLQNYFSELYTDEDDVVDLALAAQDLVDAQSEVDASVAVRYAVPVTAAAAQPLLKNWTLTIAEQLAWRHNAQGTTPENVKDRVKEVRSQLERLAEGKLVIPGAGESTTSPGGAVIISGAAPVFTREKMSGF